MTAPNTLAIGGLQTLPDASRHKPDRPSAGKRAASAKQAAARKQAERKRLVGNLATMVQEMRKVCLHPQLSKYWSSLSEGLSLNKARIHADISSCPCQARLQLANPRCCQTICTCKPYLPCHPSYQGGALGMDQILGRMAEEKQKKLQVRSASNEVTRGDVDSRQALCPCPLPAMPIGWYSLAQTTYCSCLRHSWRWLFCRHA